MLTMTQRFEAFTTPVVRVTYHNGLFKANGADSNLLRRFIKKSFFRETEYDDVCERVSEFGYWLEVVYPDMVVTENCEVSQ